MLKRKKVTRQALIVALARQGLAAVGTAKDHWHHATAGEALLLLDRSGEAHAHYAEAYRLAGNRFSDIASMRRQLLLIPFYARRQVAAWVRARNHKILVVNRVT